jgi:hypothetical protein
MTVAGFDGSRERDLRELFAAARPSCAVAVSALWF